MLMLALNASRLICIEKKLASTINEKPLFRIRGILLKANKPVVRRRRRDGWGRGVDLDKPELVTITKIHINRDHAPPNSIIIFVV